MDMDFKSDNHNLIEASANITCNNKTERINTSPRLVFQTAQLNSNDNYDEGIQIAPPPNYIPFIDEENNGTIDTGIEAEAIKPCINNYVYFILNACTCFWSYLVLVGENSAAGYRWNGCKWIYFAISLELIGYFECN